jgi:hypothetical protein
MSSPRYHVSDETLKRYNAVWIPGYENRYAYDAKNDTLYYVYGAQMMSSKCHDGYRTGEGRVWNCTVNYSRVQFTSDKIKKLIAGQPLTVKEKAKYVELAGDTYAVGRIVRDEKSLRDRIEIVAINLDSATAREVAKSMTIKELTKFVVLNVDAIVSFKVVPEVSI